MTLSHPKVIKLLKTSFVSGWTNIKGKRSYSGTSNTHHPHYRAVSTSNCAGHHNVQMFFMTPGGRVVHCLPGFWTPGAFLAEAQLAIKLARLFADPKRTIVEKNRQYLDLQLKHALKHSSNLRCASKLQSFDAWELRRKGNSDFQRKAGFTKAGMKFADQVVHERMAARPFLPFEKFQVASFVAMGTKNFDAHLDDCHRKPEDPELKRIKRLAAKHKGKGRLQPARTAKDLQRLRRTLR